MKDSGLRGRVALVTGANHGIGAATARGLASAGCDVFIHFLRHRAGNDPGAAQRMQDATFVVEGSYLERRRYRDTVQRDGFTVTFESEHRPIGWYIGALAAAGFVVERLREIAIPEESVSAPRNRRWQRLPLFLHIRAVRP